MTCAEARSSISPNLDGSLTGRQMLALQGHLSCCRECARFSREMERVQIAVSSLKRKPAPPDLQVKLRLAVSREIERSRHTWWTALQLQLDHGLQVFMVPATAGVAAALVIFGALLAFVAPPLQANSSDVLIPIQTAPRFEQTAFVNAVDGLKDDSLVIEAVVDPNGRMEDYRVLSNHPGQKELPSQVKNMLIFSTFRPATLMGRPTTGRAVLSFSKISVRG